MKESQLNDAIESSSVSEDGSSKRSAKKKKVSFKFGLETSDDAHIVKKEPNTTFDPPVSIIKKECLTRAIQSIIMPSRLTLVTQEKLFTKIEIANNVDKLNSLTFKSQFAKSKEASEENTTSNEEDQSESEDANDERRTDSDDADSDDESSHSKNDESNAHDEDNTKGVSFQLPKRSVHSSRVIKPNKKFTDDPKSANSKNGFAKKRATKIDNEMDAPEANKNEGKWIDVLIE